PILAVQQKWRANLKPTSHTVLSQMWIREGQFVSLDQRGTVCVSGSERDSLCQWIREGQLEGQLCHWIREGQFVLVDQRGTVCVSGSERDSCWIREGQLFCLPR
uniref:Uncharacterized protein n=1 Tax=Oryzias latipes TaxID=8090 RepID=A0A3B3HAU3_ORYLA